MRKKGRQKGGVRGRKASRENRPNQDDNGSQDPHTKAVVTKTNLPLPPPPILLSVLSSETLPLQGRC